MELHITAREIRDGDIFVIHGHERTASGPAWPVVANHVHIGFADGGDAVLPADRPLTVVRQTEAA